MSNPKVFEFAKEVGMTPLALMDKIREWHLPVKSHMAELDSELLATIRSKLNGPAEKSASDVEKKPVARKKSVAAASAEKPAPKKAAMPQQTIVKVTKSAKSAVQESTVAAAEKVAVSKSAVTVVRRRKTAEAQSEKDEVHHSAAGVQSADSEHNEHMKEEHHHSDGHAKAYDSAPVVEDIVVASAPSVKVLAPQPPSAAEAVISVATPAPASVAAAPVVQVANHDDHIKKAAPARKKEVAIGASGVSSESAATPRRNIIGKIDLSRVQPPPGSGGPSGYRGSNPRPQGGGYVRPPGGPAGYSPRPQGGPGGFTPRPQSGPSGSAPGFGGAPRSKGNIRVGFYSAPSPDAVTPAYGDDSEKKREEKRRMKTGAPAEGVGREVEDQPPVFDAAEFRKREMVFQPKKKKDVLDRPARQTQITKPAAHKMIVKVFGSMKVGDLAQAMGIKAPALIKVLMKNGVAGSINSELDFDTIALISPEFGFEAQNISKTAEEVIVETAYGELDAEPIVRSPVVAVMGHVDHGKTSLLDAIRKANVASGEAGGITQHIGAYQVTLDDGYKITFLDTPGHEAFTSMRARGANVTDIAIIVVAADDGVMPQTAEAINHAKAAKVPMIVVVNKIDKPGANPDRIKQQLTEYEVVPEEWGGSTIFANVSALKKTGVKELLEQIKVLAEVMELKCNPKRSGTGTVIESRLEKGRGSVATLLVQNGTVKIGQHIVAGTVQGKVRSLTNDRGERVQEAGPGMPVELLGLDGVPSAGDRFDVVKDEKAALEVAQIRKDQVDLAKNASKKLSLEEIFSKVQKGDVKELAVVLKSDVAGSMEAIQGMFQKLSTAEVKAKIIHSAIGGITENDVNLASTAKGIIIGFNVRPDSGAQAAAKRLGIDVRTYSIVYELIDDMKKAMAGMLTPDIVEKVSGKAEVRNIFTVPKLGTIAGCMVSEGKIVRTNMARLIRDGKIVYEGKLASLKRFKDDAREVAAGFECGIGIENFNDIKVGDIIEAFSKEEVARELGAPSAST